MRKFLACLFLASLFVSRALMADSSLWSKPFCFDGNDTDETILLLPDDPLAYSSAIIDGKPKTLKIVVEDTVNPDLISILFEETDWKAVEGTTVWAYTNGFYDDYPTYDTYLLTEEITSATETNTLKRLVTIMPEPAGFLLLGLAAAIFLGRRAKGLFAVLALIVTGAVSVRATGDVTSVECLQMWPFDKSVIINYTVEGYSPVGYDVKFFGSLDGGTITFPLEERGTLRRDGADGAIPRPGQYKAVWTPDDSFIGTVLDDMLIKVEISEPATDGLYMVVDLESGLVRFLHGVPEGGWTDEYRTTKMVFRRVEAGTFTMGSPTGEIFREDDEKQHEVTLTTPFFIAVFETTQKQFETIMGSDPSEYKGDTRPVERVSYEAIRGSDKGKGWPANNDVDDDSFMGKLRAKTGSAFDLPTEGMWEMACRAGTTTALNNGTDLAHVDEDENMNKLGRYDYDRGDGKGGYAQHTAVGSYLPNRRGLFDMHGNVSEWCLDRYGEYEGDATDPAGPSEGARRVLRGGSFDNGAYFCRSARRISISPSDYDSHYGFRAALIPE